MHGVYEAGLAINCISNIVTEDLARDLLPELTSLTSHPQPYLRKKAILCLFKLFVKYPQGLRLTFARLQQCLDDPNSSVVSCAVNVITELSDKNPKNYLHLAPSFFQLLTQSSNNWMLIKVVKLLGSLVPEEPRLARKLLEPLSAIVRNTQAKSLLYESVRTITLCLPYCRKSDGSMPPNVPEIVELCANTLLDFVTQADQNLKYLGLVGFSTLMQSHPHVLSDPKYRPLILACLSDQDVTIRTRALDLLNGMASKKNLIELVPQLLKHVELASGSYKKDLVSKIVEMCSGDKYTRMVDFKWYLDVLFQLGHSRGIEEHGELLMAQVTNVALRVAPVRPYAVRRSIEILLERDGDACEDPYGDNGRGKHLMLQLLPSIAWIVGEYSDQIQSALQIDPEEKNGAEFSFDKDSKGTYHAIVQCLSTPFNTQRLPTSTQKVYLQAAMKVFAAASANKSLRGSELEACISTIYMNFYVHMQSTDVEVVERAFSLIELAKALDLLPTKANVVQGNLKPVTDNDRVGDLLEIKGSVTVDPSKNEGTAIVEKMSLESKIRNSSEILMYLLKPAPMKPPAVKAQRKKRETPVGLTVDLLAPIDLTILYDIIKEEEAYRKDTRASVKAVSFTQQVPFKLDEGMLSSTNPPGMSVKPSAEPSSHNYTMNSAVTNATKPNKGDPFYLESAPSVDSNDDNDDRRFETIELPDSSDNERSRNKLRKKKKLKKSKLQIGEVSEWPTVELAVFDSEDDDDEIPTRLSAKKKGRSHEFAGLAKVDLTTPLRDDEVMPQRTHRVVPERKQSEKVVKKQKKMKKTKKIPESTGEVADLLDLGVFFSEPTTSQTLLPTISNTSASLSHPINAAFDDLFGMPTTSVAPPVLSTFLPTTSVSYVQPNDLSTLTEISRNSSKTRPWMKATLKTSNATGENVNWTEISVLFRVTRAVDGSKVGGFLVIRIDNKSSGQLTGLTLDVHDLGIVSFGPVPAYSSSNQSNKVGPIFFSAADVSEEVKATLTLGASCVPVKMKLPVALLLNPVKNLSLDIVAKELSTTGWSTTTAKIDFETTKDPNEVKAALSSFLRAHLVAGSELSAETGTYAACSTSGVPVRFLVKVKVESAKIDIKSTSSTVCKAIASDLKRLTL
jgi:AP-3 complex subunit delta